jgi:hypothetical protein
MVRILESFLVIITFVPFSAGQGAYSSNFTDDLLSDPIVAERSESQMTNPFSGDPFIYFVKTDIFALRPATARAHQTVP